MKLEKKCREAIWITGHKGMLGSAVLKQVEKLDFDILLTTSTELNLCNQESVLAWMEEKRPNYVFHIGAKVGGIMANKTQPADFILNNLLIQTNVINGAHITGVKKLIFVGSNCTYPKETEQPIPETALLTGPLDENIRSYAVSKIAGIELCRAYRTQYNCNFISIIPPNLYGPGDNYHPLHGHVVAGIMRRAHEAKTEKQKELVIWGDGTARRELIHVSDVAEAIVHLMFSNTTYEIYNVGYGSDFSIQEIAEMISGAVGFKGNLLFDSTKPNGTMKKLLDSSRIYSTGWRPKIKVLEGLHDAYKDYSKRHTLNTEVTS